eukprot:TRINITY_DN1397_c0_g1_i1.p1 TRINITY_DN1397_c0_g1~~TRINITY_DN1397_c0_g1_i1.p1  ORF type:complete len:150 (-),score=29.23 TRINITY_DN1397_c0_g1_i1:213-662(-)
MSLFLTKLNTKRDVDEAIRDTLDKVLVLRFGRENDPVCMQLDEILYKAEREVSKMATIFIVDVDAVPIYIKYFDISLIPATLFFFNQHHMKVDFGTADHTKWIGAFTTKQDFIDLVEVIYRGALRGKLIVNSPIEQGHVPKYELIYRGI